MRSILLKTLMLSAGFVGCATAETPVDPGSGGSPAGGGSNQGGSVIQSGGTQSGGATGTGGTVSNTGGLPAGGSATGGSATGGSGTGGASGGTAPSSGGQASGGSPSGGSGTGGSATGGTATGGTATGGKATGGKATGGSATGGSATGGTASGGKATGGAATGGRATGGAAMGGTTTAGGSGGAARSSGCGTTPTIPSSQYNNGTTIAITAANMQRRYILNVPTNYDNTKAYKLIFAWHQLDGNDKQMYANGYYHLLNLSGNSAIFVAPNGQKSGAPCTGTGNGESGCGWPNTNNSDLALADAVLAQIEQNFCVDTNRIFATGWSYGASMSYKHACERGLGGTKGGVAGYIRGIAVYSGAQLSGTCTPTQSVAYYGSHGTSDTVLSYDGGVTLAQNFATANGCTWTTPTRVTSGNHVCTNMTGCRTGYPVEFCSFNGGHTPDPSDGGTSWQYQLVWNFFNQF
jgi:poly(3-hydroxybutyrate) depolymerase